MKKFKIILCAILFLIAQDVSAEIDKTKYSFTNVVDGKIARSIDDGNFTIELITEEGYRINNCNTSDFMNCVCENNVCTVDVYNYGRGIMNISLENNDWTDYKEDYILVDIGLEEYLDYIVEKIPNEVDDFGGLNRYEYIASLIPDNFYSGTNCQSDNNGKEICDVEIAYYYNDYENNELVNKREIRTKRVIFNNNADNTMFYSVNLSAGSTYNLSTIYGFSNILFKDYLFISDDEDIATVNQKGIITAVSTGSTKIKVYNKKTFNYNIVDVNVKGGYLDNVDEFINLVNNKTIDIDIGSYEDISSYITSTYDMGEEIVDIKYSRIAYDYITKLFDEKMSNDYQIQYELYKHETCNEYGVCSSNLCDNDVCNIEFTYMYNGQRYTFNINDLKIQLKGLAFKNISFSVGNPSYINYYSFVNSSDIVNVEYDENFFEKNTEGELIPLKVGTTTIAITATSTDNKIYTASRKVNIHEYGQINDTLTNYVNTLNEITLPYSSDDFMNVNNLKYLENIIKEKIHNEIEIDLHSKNYLKVETFCLNKEKCIIKTYLRGENGDSLAGSMNYKYVKVKYTNTDLTTIPNLIEVDSKIENSYYLTTEEVIKIEELSSNDFDTNVINYLKINNSNLVNIEKISDYNLKEDVKGWSIYKVNITKDNQLLWSKNIKIVYNYVITMSPALDSSNESKINYLNEYINNIVSTNVLVENIKDDIYKVTTNNSSYSVIIDQRDKVYYSSINPEYRTMELSLNERKEIKLIYYPSDATVGEAKFRSLDESIATVDEKGIVTGIKKGFTYIEVIYEGSKSRVLVAVDMTVTEALNTYLDKVPSNVVVQYSHLRWNALEQAIGNEASNIFYQNDLYNLNIYVTKENDRFYAQVSNFEDYSDKKEITYELKGIKTSEYVYAVNIGETIDTSLFFSEGDNYNLTFDYSDKGIALLTNTGKLTGLKTGVVNVYINDKYYQYYNNLTVIVNSDEVYKQFENSLKDITLHVDGKEVDDYNSLYGMSNVIMNKLSRSSLNIYNLWNSYDIDCSKLDSTNKCTLHFYNATYGSRELFVDINVIKEGIYFNEKELLLDIDDAYSINYKVYQDNSNVSIASLNPEICNIEDNKIIGINTGVCTVKYSTSNYTNYQHFIVNKEGYYELINNEINNLPNNISLKIEDKNWYLSEDYTDMVFFDTVVYEELNNNYNKEYVDHYFRHYDEENTDKNKVIISASPKSYFEDRDTDYYYYFRTLNDYMTNLDTKTLDITYLGLDPEIKEIVNKLKLDLPKKYHMSFMEYLTFELETKNTEEYISLFEYSNFKEELNKICSKCTYTEDGGGGLSLPGYIEFFAPMTIRYEGMPIYMAEFNVSGGFNVELDNDFTEEEYLEALKKEFLKAYLEAKENANVEPVNSVKTYSVMPLKFANTNTFARRLNDELEVTIEKSFNQEVKKPEYIFTVEDYSVAVIVDTKINGELVYTTKLLDITTDISDIILDIGSKKQVNVDFSPKDATNKNIAWISSNDKVATVKNGLITAVASGDAVIKVVSEDGNITKEIKVTVKENKVIIGDVTGDKIVNISDLVTFRKYLAGKTTIHQDRLLNADINKDGKTNITDLVNLRKMLAK